MLSLSPKQRHFLAYSDAQINVLHGAVRSGKTFAADLRWLKFIKEGPPGKLLMSGRTKESLRENVLNDLFAILGEGNYDYQERRGYLRIYGREIEIRGAEKIDAEKVIRGREYAGWYGDEITIHHPEFVRTAVARCSVRGAQIFWTTNPDHPDHHIRTNFIRNPDLLASKQLKAWHFLITDNHTLSREYIRLLENSFSGVFYDRNILGKWVLAKGVIFNEFYKPEIMRVPHSEVLEMCRQGKFVNYIAGVDWGSTHPMVGLIIGVTIDNKYYVIAEYYKTHQLTDDIIAWFQSWEEFFAKKISILYCDSAEPDRIMQMRIAGLRAKGADKAINEGINSTQSVMKGNRFYISGEAEETHLEFGKYRYPDPDDFKSVKDIPLDMDNHAMDALRYAIHNYEMYLGVLYLAAQRKKRRRR